MPKKINRLAGWADRIGQLPEPEQSRTRDFIFTHVMLSVSTMRQLNLVRQDYLGPAMIAEYGESHCTAVVTMIDGYIALREMKLTQNISRLRKRREKTDD